MEWIVLILLLLIVVATIWYLYSADLTNNKETINNPGVKETGVTGSSELNSIQREVLDILESNLKEYGTQNITEHLHNFYDYTKSQKADLKAKLKRSDLALKPSGLKYLALLIQEIADRNNIVDAHEFIEDSGIVGYTFMRPAVKARVLSAVQPYTAAQLTSIKDLIRDVIREKNSSADPSSILKQIESIRMYTLNKKRMEPDFLALRPIINTMIGAKPAQAQPQKDLDRLIERIKLLQMLKDYPSIRLDRVTSLSDLLDRLKPLDPHSYLEGKKDAERMFTKLVDKDKELERSNEKLQQELKDKAAADRLQVELDQKAKAEADQKANQKAEEERIIREEFDKILNEDPALQQQIADNDFSREQLYEQFKIRWVGGAEAPDKDKIIRIIKEILENKK